MKRFLFCIAGMLTFLVSQAQLNPVTWSFTANKVADRTYEVHLKANLQSGWHLFSQEQPEDNIALPTNFTFNKNPVLVMEGKIKEIGKMETVHDAKLELSSNQYANSVDFVQVVRLKGKVKTKLTGNVEFQTCDDKKCLPPKTVNFSVAIQ